MTASVVRLHPPYAAVVCHGGHGEGIPGCGSVDLTEPEYSRQMGSPHQGWSCPRCGGSATYDDARSELLQGVAEDDLPLPDEFPHGGA